MRLYFSVFLVLGVLFLIDLLIYTGLRNLLKVKSKRTKSIVYSTHWILALSFYAGVYYIFTHMPDYHDVAYYQRIFSFFSLGILLGMPKMVWMLFIFLHWIGKIPDILKSKEERRSSSRRNFLLKAGMVMAGIPFLSILHGITFGRFRFTVHRVKPGLRNLSDSFHNYRIVQLSDMHIPCYLSHPEELERLVTMVNDLEPDLLVFTGDMVNNSSSEMEPFVDILAKLHAKDGMLSILGNHDYGDYTQWPSEDAKKADHQKLIAMEEQAGFKLLRNELFSIKRGEDILEIIGVENYGKPPFPQYGDLKKAMKHSKAENTRILLSHDPSHFDLEVLGKEDIPLTLSGHTHGMQFGVEIGALKWSPIQFKYPHWAGLYSTGDQHLYVNRGCGTLGYSGRTGIWPEITLIELQKA